MSWMYPRTHQPEVHTAKSRLPQGPSYRHVSEIYHVIWGWVNT